MQLVIDDLMSSTTDVSVSAAKRIGSRATREREAVLERCNETSRAMSTFVRVAREQSVGALTHADLDAVMAAYRAWAKPLGEVDLVRYLWEAQRSCRALRRDLRISYRAWWRWSDTGRDWWVELDFRNDRPIGYFAGLSGLAQVSDLERPAYFAGGRPRRDGLMRWGGSGYDNTTIRPGASRHLVDLGNGPYLATGPTGTFDVEQIEVSVDLPRRRWWCTLPVPEGS